MAGKLQNYLAARVSAYYQKLLFRFKPLHGRSQAMLSKLHIPEGIWFLWQCSVQTD